MRLLFVVLICFLSTIQLRAAENTVLAQCNNVADEVIKKIVVSHSSDLPANILVSVLYRDNSRGYATVGAREWRQKSFTLPSRESFIYRLKLHEQDWYLFQADTNTLMRRQVECQLTTL